MIPKDINQIEKKNKNKDNLFFYLYESAKALIVLCQAARSKITRDRYWTKNAHRILNRSLSLSLYIFFSVAWIALRLIVKIQINFWIRCLVFNKKKKNFFFFIILNKYFILYLALLNIFKTTKFDSTGQHFFNNKR